MSIRKEIVDDIKHWEGFSFRIQDRPFMEVWPDDEFAEWVSSHSDRGRNTVCNTPKFRATPYCGVGYIQSGKTIPGPKLNQLTIKSAGGGSHGK